MPRKFGQHFLRSEPVLHRIAEAACGEHAQRVVEIGPGRGALTRHLLPRCDELHCIEVDSGLIPQLRIEFPSANIVHADVLETPLDQWGPAIIAGNLPYYITSPIIEKFLRLGPEFSRSVFLIQYEVAARLLAKEGTRDYGYLTVATRLICDVELVTKVPPGAFSPPPKVDSAVVTLHRRPKTIDIDPILTLASRAFAHKRKTLRNNLKGFYAGAIETMPEASLRAEQLSVRELIDLAARLTGTTE